MTRVLAIVLAVGALLLILATAFGVHYMNAYHAAEKQEAALTSANQTCVKAVNDLQKANQLWADKFNTNAADAAALTQAQDAYRDQLQAKYDASQKALAAALARTPQSRAWSVVPVPAVVSDSLRAAAR